MKISLSLLMVALLIGGTQVFAANVANGEIVEIIVQFVTPSVVELELEGGSRTRVNYEARARAAHTAFRRQLGQIPVPFGSQAEIEIFSEHYTLFNGMYMRVPEYMVGTIAELPEVYAIFPNEELVPFASEEFAPGNPALLAEARQLLDINYIHNELGITGRNIRVAVMDTGIDHAHPEFERFLVNGRVPGYDFYVNPNPATNHGTNVSGALVAIAPGIELFSYRIAMGSSGGTFIGALERARADGAQIVNMSFGTAVTSAESPIGQAATNAVLDGMVVVAAVGNSGPRASTIYNPAAQPLVLGVGSGTAGGRDGGDTVSSFSSRGPTRFTYLNKPDIVAPGQRIYTTTLGGNYMLSSGTSISAPIVSGIAALMLEAEPNLTPQEIMARLKNTARPLADPAANDINASGAGFVVPIAALPGQPGDINGDGRVNNRDTYALRRHLVAGIAIAEENADLNRDGEVDILDLTILRLILSGKEVAT